MNEPTNPLRESDFMQALLDLVIPPSADGRMPGAGNLGIAPTLADVIEADRQLGPVAVAGLRALRTAALARDPAGLSGLSLPDRRDVVEAQFAGHPMFMNALLRFVYPAYYQHPRVLESLGEPPRPPFPEGYEVEATDARLLEKLHARRRGV